MPDPTPGVAIPAASTPAAAQPAAAQAPKPTGQPAAAASAAPAKPATPATPAPQAGGAAQQVPLATLMEERDRRQALQAELDQLRSTVRQQQPAPGFQQQQPQVDMQAQMDKLWQEDPRKAVQTEIKMAAQWMDNVNAQVDGEAAQLAAKYTDFNNYRDTAMRYVRALPLDQRARPGIVEMAYLVTRGQNVDQIIEQQRQQMTTQFLQNPAAFQMPAGTGTGAPVVGAPQATEAQIRAAGAMRIPIDQYLKWVK